MSDAVPASAPGAAPAPAAIPDPTAGQEPLNQPEDPNKPERTFTQKELDEILEKRLSKERRKREELKREAEVLRRLALERGEKQPEKPKQVEAGEPKREDFDSYEAYIEARAEWRADKRYEEREKKKREEEERSRTAAEQQKQAEAYRKLVKESAKGIEDFEDVMEDALRDENSPVGRLHTQPIVMAENPAKVLYYLATHQDEAERVASLSAIEQAREVRKIEQKLNADPQGNKKPPSAAPEPLDPVGKGKGKVTTEEPSDKDDFDAWLKKRNAQLRRKKG